MNDEHEVRAFLQSLGFAVKKIPEATEKGEKRPDFLVDTEYLVEVKGKEDTKFQDLLRSLIPGEKTLSLGYQNKISSIVEEGVKQLTSHEESDTRFKILWFVVDQTSPFSELVARQISWTLFGLMELKWKRNNNQRGEAGCFYFTYSEFYKFKQLDVAVIQTSTETTLCVNDQSERYDEVRASKLYKLALNSDWTVIDPIELEKKGRCFSAADCNISRKDSDAIFRYIADKYNLRQIVANDFYLFPMPLDE